MSLKQFLHSEEARKPHFVLFGNPVSHSLSPLMHNTAAKYYNLNVRYFAVQLEWDKHELIPDFLNNEQLKGLNLTIPFKYDFLKYTNELSSACKKLEAVNAFVKNRNGWKGYNTDIYGFGVPLKKYEEEIEGKDAVIFGTGGAAKAAAYALSKIGVNEITFVSRQSDQTNETSNGLATRIISYKEWTEFTQNAKLFVNATPLGMKPYLEESPVKDDEKHLLKDSICYDLIYNPPATKFLKLGESSGAVAINGLDMLIHQGSKLFELWTGKSFPIGLIKRRLNEKLNEKY